MMPIFVTGNQHKADYLSRLLGIELAHKKLELDEIQSSDPRVVIEHKVRQAYSIIAEPVLVEDTCLGFDALDGLPGPFIKYFIESKDGPEKLCRMCDGLASRRATATVTFGFFDGVELRVFQQTHGGEIATSPGEMKTGFGWDTIYIPDGYNGQIRSELSTREYDELYRKVKPIASVKAYLEERFNEIN